MRPAGGPPPLTRRVNFSRSARELLDRRKEIMALPESARRSALLAAGIVRWELDWARARCRAVIAVGPRIDKVPIRYAAGMLHSLAEAAFAKMRCDGDEQPWREREVTSPKAIRERSRSCRSAD